MGWAIVAAVVVVVAAVVRRLVRGRRSPVIDEQRLENANYSRIGQEVHDFDVRYGPM